jgi:malate dehydrogenase (oxaloacetate-decarboxylating)
MKLAAAQAIASIVSKKERHEEYVIPSVFNKKVAPAVAREVMRAAQKGGVARRRRRATHS